eukprot:5806495-Amphidinium_carterae.1
MSTSAKATPSEARGKYQASSVQSQTPCCSKSSTLKCAKCHMTPCMPQGTSARRRARARKQRPSKSDKHPVCKYTKGPEPLTCGCASTQVRSSSCNGHSATSDSACRNLHLVQA